MPGHVILCGLGKIGFSILELLHQQKVPVHVITTSIHADWSRRASLLATKLFTADARDNDVLADAGIMDARSIVVATNDDLVNIEIAIDAQSMRPDIPVVLRLYDESLAARARRDLSVRAVLNSATISAPAFVAAARGAQFLRAIDVETAAIDVVRLRVDGEGAGAGESLEDFCALRRLVPLQVSCATSMECFTSEQPGRTLSPGDEVIAAEARGHESPVSNDSCQRSQKPLRRKREGMARLSAMWTSASLPAKAALFLFPSLLLLGTIVFHFAMRLSWIDAFYFASTVMTTVGFGDFHFRDQPGALKLFGSFLMFSGAGMMIIAFGLVTDYLVRERFRDATKQSVSGKSDHVIVVGLGHLAQQVIPRLLGLRYEVVAIDKDAERDTAESLPKGVVVIVGDANKASTLDRAGIAGARALVAVTDDDLVNLRTAHFAEERSHAARTVVRLFESSLAGKLAPALFGADVALNPSQAAAAAFAAHALVPNVSQAFVLEDRLLLLRWVDVKRGSDLAGKAAGDGARLGIPVLLRRSDAGSLVPVTCADRIEVGDRLVVLEEYSHETGETGPCTVRWVCAGTSGE